MRAKEYPALIEALQEGLQCGWNRAHKHDDAPTEETILEAQHDAVLNAILERFSLERDAE